MAHVPLRGLGLYGLIADLKGIEAFINLDSLSIKHQGEISDVDLSGNTKLTYLNYNNKTSEWCCGKKGAPVDFDISENRPDQGTQVLSFSSSNTSANSI